MDINQGSSCHAINAIVSLFNSIKFCRHEIIVRNIISYFTDNRRESRYYICKHRLCLRMHRIRFQSTFRLIIRDQHTLFHWQNALSHELQLYVIRIIHKAGIGNGGQVFENVVALVTHASKLEKFLRLNLSERGESPANSVNHDNGQNKHRNERIFSYAIVLRLSVLFVFV